jgi:hypothetical protein
MDMFNVQALINAIELQIEIEELQDLGLNDEEVQGFIETFCESWIVDTHNLVLN